MDNTLREHILNLENRIQALSDQVTNPRREAPERDQIESEILAARLALEYYRKAFSLEQEIASSLKLLDTARSGRNGKSAHLRILGTMGSGGAEAA